MIPWYGFALGAAAFVVVRDLAHKKALKHEHTLEMLVARGLFLLPLLLILGFAIDTRLQLGTVVLLYLASVIATLGIMLRVRGLRHLDVGQAAPLQNFQPLFLLVVAFLVIGERPGPVQLLGVLLLVFGTYILEGSEEYPGVLGPIKHLIRDPFAWLIIGAALVLSIGQSFDKYLIGAGIDPLVYFFWVWLFTNLNFIMIHLTRFRWRGLRRDIVRDWRWLGLAALALFGQMLCYFTAVSLGPITLIAPITRLSALGLVIVGGRLLHEEALGRRIVAALCMVVGAALIIGQL